MPETGNHEYAEQLHNELTQQGFQCVLGSGNRAGDITYHYAKLGQRRYLVVRRNGRHFIETDYRNAFGQGLLDNITRRAANGKGTQAS